MAYKIRVILDVEKDVFRDLVISKNTNLEDLHFFIAKSFGFNGQEMASFYKSNDQWEQGEEYPLFDMAEDATNFSMSNYSIENLLKKKGDKLIYVYDFFSLWTFYIELKEIINTTEKDINKVVLSFGFPPENAPQKEFVADDTFEDFDAFNDDDFENLDDIDFDNY